MQVKLRKDQSLLIWASVASLALWVVPWLRPALFPLIYYNTHIHELCHALAGVLSGGGDVVIKVFADGSGVTRTLGGSPILLATSGYVGSAIVGGILIFGSRTVQSAKRTLWVAASFFAFSMVFFVRGDVVGVVSGIGWLVALVSMALWLKGDAKIFAVQFLGIQQCLTSVYAFLALLQVSTMPGGHRDAGNMEQATHVPAIVWAVLWLFIALAVIGFGVRSAWSSKPRS